MSSRIGADVTEFHIGIDDTDSRNGGCTTYTATLVFEELRRKGFRPTDFPWLVRLNPNIPWKTRGNGALAIHLLTENDRINEAARIALDLVSATSDCSDPESDPTISFLKGPIPQRLREFSVRALYDVLSVAEAESIASIVRADVRRIKGTRGIIGSLAAIGASLDVSEHTFEIIAYRSKTSLGKPRQVDRESVKAMDSEFEDQTFQNVDNETGRVLICPHGPDPVLLGIRGYRPELLVRAFKLVQIGEPIERMMIFKTNQGTDAHIRSVRFIADLRPFQSALVSGRVNETPRILRGGHVVFRIEDQTGSLDCVAFKASGGMTKIARELQPEDRVNVAGGVRQRDDGLLSLNLEKIDLLQITDVYREQYPLCKLCHGHCESMGKNQGFRCKKCGSRFTTSAKLRTLLERDLQPSANIPPPRSRRHLTRACAQISGIDTKVRDEYSYEEVLGEIRALSLISG